MPDTSQPQGSQPVPPLPGGGVVAEPTVLLKKSAVDDIINGLSGASRQWSNMTAVGALIVLVMAFLYYMIDNQKFQQEQMLENMKQRIIEHQANLEIMNRNQNETAKARDEIRDVQTKVVDLLIRNEKLMAMGEAQRKDAVESITAVLKEETQKTRDVIQRLDSRIEANHKEALAAHKLIAESLRKLEARTAPDAKGERMSRAVE